MAVEIDRLSSLRIADPDRLKAIFFLDPDNSVISSLPEGENPEIAVVEATLVSFQEPDIRGDSDTDTLLKLAACIFLASGELANECARRFALTVKQRNLPRSNGGQRQQPTEVKLLPDLVFCNLVNSGSSALDPVLRELLAGHGYVPGTYPNSTDQLREFCDQPQPVYHWTHDALESFLPLITGDYGERFCKFLYLYRDPRDVLVSHVKDIVHRGINPGKSESELQLGYIQTAMRSWLYHALQWIALPKELCIPVSFEEMKSDLPGLFTRILSFLDLAIDQQQLLDSLQRHSFEAVANRPRGEDGPMVRNAYMYRKGTSGEWVKELDKEIKREFRQSLGKYLVAMGYEDVPPGSESDL